MRKKILISAPYMVRDREKVERMLQGRNLDVAWASVRERMEENELLEIIGGFHGIICGDDRLTAKVMEYAPNLKVIVKWGTGVDSIDHKAAGLRKIAVRRTPGAFTEPVADTTLAYILAFCRRIVDNDQVLKTGGWDKPPGFALFESTVGLIGFGDIGAAVARRLKAFGATILANDIRPERERVAQEVGAKFVSKEELFRESDFISLHCDLNETSHHVLNEAVFSGLTRKPFIVNTARGPLIDEPALIRALQAKTVAGAGLDVFEEEPLPPSSPLRSMTNVLLASHNSNNSPKCWDRVHANSISMLCEELGLPL